MWAAGEGHLQVCQYLVNTCKVPALLIAGPNKKRQRNALHWAARNGHAEVVQWLVSECGVPVDVSTSDGTTPFMYAVWKGHLDVCTWLVEEAKCQYGATNGFGCNAIQWCVQTGDVAMCEYLLGIGLNVRLCNKNGHSALHKAAVKGQRGACEWLVSRGGLGLAQMQPDKDGNRPSDMARLDGFSELAVWLHGKETGEDLKKPSHA